MYMKILHYVIFFSSNAVKNYLYSKEIDPNTIHLNDFKFMERIFYIITNLLGLKPRIHINQFFKYGFAEQKMMMCVEAIRRVKELSKEIRINTSLLSTRKKTVRATSSHSRSSSVTSTPFKQNRVKVKLASLAEVQEDMKNDFFTAQKKEATKHLTKKKKRTRKESLECSMRLTGSQAFQTVNRHRVNQSTIESPAKVENPFADTQSDKLISSLPLRYRGVQPAFENNGNQSFTHVVNHQEPESTE